MSANCPKISVIIPVHKDSGYLQMCLDSAANQTLANIEIICIDDASTDGAKRILVKFAERDPRVRIIRYETSRSASQARKDGALAATGEYVMFLDSDDYLDLHLCEELYHKIREMDIDILQFGTVVINSGGLSEARINNLRKFVHPHSQRLEGDEILKGCFQHKLYGFSLWNKIYTAELCRKAFANIPDAPFYKAQDLLAYFILAFYAKSYIGLSDIGNYHYRFGAGLTGQTHMSFDRFSVFCTQAGISREIKKFLEKRGCFAQYASIHKQIHEELVFECVWNWLRNLNEKDQGPGFSLLLDTWGRQDVTACLTWRKDYDRLHKDYKEACMHLDAMRNSWRWRIGRAFIYLPAKIIKLFSSSGAS